MDMQILEKEYREALEKLAGMLSLNYGEIANFCGDVEDGAFTARRLKEFFKTPLVAETLDSIVRISDEYRCLSGGEQAATSSCR
jgi:hypothetical protein